MANKVAVITANLGGFDPIFDYIKQSVDYDFYRFIDENFSPRTRAMTPRMQARIIKCFAWQLVPGYEYYIWVDGSCSLWHEDSVKWFLEQCEGADIAFFKHPDRDTIQQECDFIKRCRNLVYIRSRYLGEFLDEQMAEIKSDPDYVDDMLLASTAFVYKDGPKVHAMLKEWWYHISRYHIIDQLALPYVLKNSDCKFNIINENYGKIPCLTYTRKRKMDTLEYIIQKYQIEKIPTHNIPIVIPFMRDGLADLFEELDFNIGAEIGVDQGLYSEVLCKANPRLTLYGIDSWKAYKGYTDYTSQEHIDANKADALKRLEPYNCKIVQKFSMDAVKDYPDQFFDFVYIDGNHEFKHVTEDIATWSKKVRTGGILAGHDYRRTSNAWVCHVVDVVNGWTYAHKISPWFLTNAVDTPSWFWVM